MEEITFYDGKGHPLIYLSPDNDDSFYLWSGHAVAYLIREQIFGWRGNHIGWLIDGVIYNLEGYRVGSTREKCPYAVYAEYAKYAKYARYARYGRYAPYAKPALQSTYSNIGLEEFISQNRV
ncbi:4-fold beta flower protein [Fluviicola chungangensis]|uniref:4-fold beta flower domain-containing protein n=1 Tax=Fluviicola chungangensis TaxID=2597671 RepID=A0A556N681_9FLAO|nr:hypothetical protein [Fluviicola chungangensis]TSJ47618.1 hypothetical protein FO442_00385 [Fluviicola chungangensis]